MDLQEGGVSELLAVSSSTGVITEKPRELKHIDVFAEQRRLRCVTPAQVIVIIDLL